MATKTPAEGWVVAAKEHLDNLESTEKNICTFYAVAALTSALLAIANAIIKATPGTARK